MRYFNRVAVAAGALFLGACSNWLSVDTPNVIDDALIDPVRDADILARSAEQNFAAAYGHLIVYSSWFVGETDVSETFPTRNEFGRRSVVIQNGSLDTDVWFPLSQTVASAYKVMDAPLPDTTANLNYTRAGLFLAYSYLFMAEQFCEGAVRGGPPLTTANMLDSARSHFMLAIARGRANGTADGRLFKNSGFVGLARTELQAGNLAAAITAADSVPAGFVHNLDYMDDLASRFRVANRMWFYVRDRGSIAVAPIWRVGPNETRGVVQDSEPRVPWMLPVTTGPTAYAPQDNFYASDRGFLYAIQQKYPAYNSPVRLASKLEADYIKAEAQTTTERLAIIDARRAANGQPVFSDSLRRNTPDSVLTQFFTQKGFEFYLEGKRLGDFRRHPTNIIGVPVAGAPYWKPGFAPIGNQTCYPLPITETDNNPNFP
jgi:hypothetical protein